ncbi:MAG: BCD family MFS transporter [Pseudomonadota bacterium]
MSPPAAGLGWLGIVRLGFVQTALGAIVVLTTSTLNRVMVVELGLLAALPGVLVALHYMIQITRPRFGHGSDVGGRRTPWIIGGIAVLGTGGILASLATLIMVDHTLAGIALAVLAFSMIGAGVGAAGTSLLVLLAAMTTPTRRAPAATITWLMMITGFAVTAGVAGALLDPFSMQRLLAVTAAVAAIALTVTILAVWGIEPRAGVAPDAEEPAPERGAFIAAVREVLAERHTRRFGLFVFISMLAYSAQDLVLEPFAGAVFGYTPGDSTQLGGLQHGGVLIGMIAVAFIGARVPAALRQCMIGGCLISAILLGCLALSGQVGPGWPLAANVFALGAANGVFAVAAIGSMMHLVSEGSRGRDGVRMGVWGAAQAIAFGLGGILGTAAIDIIRYATGEVAIAYSLVFAAQATLFVSAAILAARISRRPLQHNTRSAPTAALIDPRGDAAHEPL